MTSTILQAPPRLRFRVRVRPKASRSQIAGVVGDAVKVHLTANAANAALLAFLAEVLDVPRATIRVVSGEHARDKLIEVEARDPAAVEARLTQALSAPAR